MTLTEMAFDTEQFYNCESWENHISELELEEVAEWVEEEDERD